MISYIIIGRNEGKKIINCINSIYEAIKYNALINYEIIYVDSKSTDKSIEIVKRFEEVKVFKVTGDCNAAIGRNIGASEATGDLLYFIDADMEVCKEFLAKILDSEKKINYDILSGQVIDIEDNVIKNGRYNKNKCLFHKYDEPLDGGVFLIKKSIWDSVNGMRTKFNNGEDGDLGLRLAKKGFHFIRKNETITLHNTTNYLNHSRIWKMLFTKSLFYSRCVLYRDHINNQYMYYKLWKNEKTFVLLIFILINCFVFQAKSSWLILIYIISILFRSLKQDRYVSLISFFVYFILVDILNLVYLFTFFPKNKKITYKKVNGYNKY